MSSTGEARELLKEVSGAMRDYRKARAIRDEAIAEAAVVHGGDETAFSAGLSATRVRQIVRELRRQGWIASGGAGEVEG